MKAYNRLLAIGVLVLPVLVCILIIVYQKQPYIPEALQEKLAQESCLYNSAEDCYQIPGVAFGRGLSEIVADMGLKKWYTKQKVDAINQGLSGDCLSSYSDPFAVSAFDAKYCLIFGLSKNGECYRIRLYGSFVFDPQTPIPYDNIIEYDDACTYFYNLYDEFVVSYGEPDKSDFPVDLNEVTLDYFTGDNRYYPEVCAYWMTGEEGQQSVLRLSAKPHYTENTDSKHVLDLSVYIGIGQEIEGISIDDLMKP